MLRFFILLSFLIYSCVAAPKTPAATAAGPAKKWLTLNGKEPVVVARGGFSGLFPESSAPANDLAVSSSSPGLTVLCNLQMTKDGAGICLSDIRLDNATTISTLFPKAQKTYKVNGQDLKGWFALDYSADTIFSNVSLVQNIFSRPSIFDGQMPVAAVEEVLDTKPPKFWLSVQYDLFYMEHKLSAAEYLRSLRFRGINFISSPEIGFLKSIGKDARRAKTKLIFEFKDPKANEPTTNKKYSELQQDLAAIKAFASGVLVPKDYIWPLDSANYLKPSSTIVAEYLQFVENGQFSVDGFITDFPPTASQAITCFSHQKRNLPKVGNALVITHNGASGDYPGCTDLAYQKAVDDGADVIDCSVQMSKDGIAFCLDSADLIPTTTAMITFMSRATSVPEIQPTNGIFSFDLTWAEIQSLKPQIQSPFLASEGFQRNPANKNAGKFMTLVDFLKFSKAKAVTGVLINIQNAAYLASKKGLGIVDAVKSALTSSTIDKKVLIQSDDSSVLDSFKAVPSYTRVLSIDKEIGDAPKPTIEEIKKHADAVNLKRSSLVTTSQSFATGKTKVVEEMHKGNISVVWSCDVEKAKSWTWRALLHLRCLASRFIRAKVGNGRLISFWWDTWTPFGKLIEYFGPNGPRELSIPLHASISNACNRDGWLVRGARAPAAETLHIYLTTVTLPTLVTENDSFFWLVNDIPLNKFSAKLTWEALRHKAPSQPWSSYVWFKGAIPRHSFNMWLAQLDRLPTRARLSKWGINIPTSCCLCNNYTEDRDHLFLRCVWSVDLWNLCLQRMGYSCMGFHTWLAFSEWLRLHDRVVPRLLKRLVASATIYAIWSERNKRYHDNISSPAATIFKLLDRFIRDAILSKRNQKQSCGLMQRWLSKE